MQDFKLKIRQNLTVVTWFGIFLLQCSLYMDIIPIETVRMQQDMAEKCFPCSNMFMKESFTASLLQLCCHQAAFENISACFPGQHCFLSAEVH